MGEDDLDFKMLDAGERKLASDIADCQIIGSFRAYREDIKAYWCTLITDDCPKLDCCFRGEEFFRSRPLMSGDRTIVYYKCKEGETK